MSESTVDPAAAAAIHRDLADLQKQVRDLKSLQASGRRWVLATMLIIVLMFATFSWGLYTRIKHNFNDQAVQKAVSEQGADIVPMAESMLKATGQTLLPVYRDAALAVLRKEGPAAGQMAVDRLKAIPQDSGVAFKEKMQAAFDAAVKRVEPDFKAAYPKLADDRRQQILQSFMTDQIASQNSRLATQVDRAVPERPGPDADHAAEVRRARDGRPGPERPGAAVPAHDGRVAGRPDRHRLPGPPPASRRSSGPPRRPPPAAAAAVPAAGPALAAR